mgnify:FL=1
MNFAKKLIVMGTELAILWFVSYFIAVKWAIPALNESGDTVLFVGITFAQIFLLNSVSYFILRFIYPKTKGLTLQKDRRRKIGLLTLAVFLPVLLTALGFLYVYSTPELVITVGNVKAAPFLLLLPIPLFLLHLGIAKILAKGKAR